MEKYKTEFKLKVVKSFVSTRRTHVDMANEVS